MTKGIIIGVIALIVVGGGGFLIFHKSSTTKPNSTAIISPPSGSSSPSASTPSSSSSTPAATGQTASFTINANDESADKESVSVAKGASVSITFNVDSQGVYHGGLQFKSTDPALDSGPIAVGASKTVTFTADKTFSFQPYWYASGVKKDYLITVNVT